MIQGLSSALLEVHTGTITVSEANRLTMKLSALLDQQIAAANAKVTVRMGVSCLVLGSLSKASGRLTIRLRLLKTVCMEEFFVHPCLEWISRFPSVGLRKEYVFFTYISGAMDIPNVVRCVQF